MLINCTNHPTCNWSKAQIQAGKEYGEITDLPFPTINPRSTEQQLRILVNEYMERIIQMKPDAVIVAGEFSFVFMLVDALLQQNIKVLCTRSWRDTCETVMPDGNTEKTSVFVFDGFFEYAYYGENR